MPDNERCTENTYFIFDVAIISCSDVLTSLYLVDTDLNDI